MKEVIDLPRDLINAPFHTNSILVCAYIKMMFDADENNDLEFTIEDLKEKYKVPEALVSSFIDGLKDFAYSLLYTSDTDTFKVHFVGPQE